MFISRLLLCRLGWVRGAASKKFTTTIYSYVVNYRSWNLIERFEVFSEIADSLRSTELLWKKQLAASNPLSERKMKLNSSPVSMTMITVGFNSVSRAVARSIVSPFTVRALSTSETLKVSSTTNATASPPVAARKEERIKYFKIYRWDPDHSQKPVS